MLKITIPTPCHEDWNKMTPDQTGRHCNTCAKSVVDFTNMSDEEVKYFFINKKEEERVCGRFKQTQLHRVVIELPQSIFSIQMPLWKKFLAACLVVFSTTLFSCETKIGDGSKTGVQEQTIQLNSTIGKPVPMMLGGIGYTIIPDSIKTIEVCTETVGITFVEPIEIDTPEVLQGDIDIVEIQPVDCMLAVPVKDTTYTSFTEEPIKAGEPLTAVKTKIRQQRILSIVIPLKIIINLLPGMFPGQ